MIEMLCCEHALQMFREFKARWHEFEQLDRQDQAEQLKRQPQRLTANEWNASIVKKQRIQNLAKVRQKRVKNKVF
jgi:hypothetical protein